MAALDGETDKVRKLLEAGAEVHAKDDSGLTTLMDVAWVGQTEVVKTLLQAGAGAKD